MTYERAATAARYQHALGQLRKIAGTTYPIEGEIVVRRTHAKEHYAIDGTAYTSPRLEERLLITIERDGAKVG